MSYYIEQLMYRSLTYYLHRGFTNDLVPKELDIRTTTDPVVDCLDSEVFYQGSEWANEPDAPEFHPIFGSYRRHHDDDLFTHHFYKVMKLALDDDCRFEPGILEGYADLDYLILIMPDVDDNTTRQLLLTPQTYALASPFVSTYDQRFFWEAYLDLPEQERKTLYRFLTRPGVAQYFCLCVCYLSTLMIKKGHSLSPRDVPEALEAVRLHTFRFPGVRFERCSTAEVLTLLELCGFFHVSPAWHMAPALFAILNRVSAYRLPVEEALLASELGGMPFLYAYLDLIATSDQIRRLSRAVSEDLFHDRDPQLCDHILLHLLRTKTALEPPVISRINGHLFTRKVLSLEDANQLTPIRRGGVNWDPMLDDLFRRVNIALSAKTTHFIRALALAWMCDIGDLQEALDTGAEMILNGGTDAAILVGMETLSFFLRQELSGTEKKKSPVRLEQVRPIMEALATWLSVPNLYYNHAAALAQNLVHWGADSEPLHDPRIKETALARLREGRHNRIYPCIVLHLLDRIL